MVRCALGARTNQVVDNVIILAVVVENCPPIVGYLLMEPSRISPYNATSFRVTNSVKLVTLTIIANQTDRSRSWLKL